jgi:hypothetical protein
MIDERYPVLQVDPHKLMNAAYQPESRTLLNGALKKLEASIKEVGLQYPPLVTRRADNGEFTIIDGHRRVRVAKELGWPVIPVIVSSQGDATKLFAAVSGASKPLSAIEWVQVFLGDGELPSGPTSVCINQLAKVMGKDFLKELVEKNISPQIWNFSKKVMKYIGLADEQERPTMIRWIATHKLSQQLSAGMQMKTNPARIMQLFRENASKI